MEIFLGKLVHQPTTDQNSAQLAGPPQTDPGLDVAIDYRSHSANRDPGGQQAGLQNSVFVHECVHECVYECVFESVFPCPLVGKPCLCRHV